MRPASCKSADAICPWLAALCFLLKSPSITSRDVEWAGSKRVRLTFAPALLVGSEGVATAEPTSKSRDWISSSCNACAGQTSQDMVKGVWQESPSKPCHMQLASTYLDYAAWYVSWRNQARVRSQPRHPHLLGNKLTRLLDILSCHSYCAVQFINIPKGLKEWAVFGKALPCVQAWRPAVPCPCVDAEAAEIYKCKKYHWIYHPYREDREREREREGAGGRVCKKSCGWYLIGTLVPHEDRFSSSKRPQRQANSIKLQACGECTTGTHRLASSDIFVLE